MPVLFASICSTLAATGLLLKNPREVLPLQRGTGTSQPGQKEWAALKMKKLSMSACPLD